MADTIASINSANTAIPEDILSSLTTDQKARLNESIKEQALADHALKYQASSSLFGRKFYLAFFFGKERRSDERVGKDDQKKPFHMVAFFALMIAICFVGLFFGGLMLAVVGAYLFKSAVGIDLFEEHSFLHGLLFF